MRHLCHVLKIPRKPKEEPEKNQPGYYLRFLKTFRRMAGDFHYVEMDNRAFLLNLWQLLR